MASKKRYAPSIGSRGGPENIKLTLFTSLSDWCTGLIGLMRIAIEIFCVYVGFALNLRDRGQHTHIKLVVSSRTLLLFFLILAADYYIRTLVNIKDTNPEIFKIKSNTQK